MYTSTGRNGGLVAYQLDANGNATVTTTVIFPPEITLSVTEKLVFNTDGSGPVLYVGSNAHGLMGYAIGANGLGNATHATWTSVESMAAGGSIASVEALIVLAEHAPNMFPHDFDATQIVDLVNVTVNGQSLIITANELKDEITAYRIDPSTGNLVEVGVMGALQGLGINAPTAMEVVEIGGQSYVIVAASGTSSISVLKVMPDGSMLPVDHVLDNGTTLFEGVQDLAVAQSGDHTFVVAGGADNGLTLFLMLPDGSLVFLQSIADSDATSMHKITAIDVVIDGNVLHVFVGSQNEAGLTQFTIDLSTLGDLQTGTAAYDNLRGGAGDDILIAVGAGDRLTGGAGDDVLVAGTGQTTMTGGTGADIYVIGDGSGATLITDFERGQDRLDLTGLPMLRDLSQLTYTVTSTGGRIDYRGHSITLTSADGRPLSLADVFPNGLTGGDHYEFYPSDETPPGGDGSRPGVEVDGTAFRDTIVGTEFNDILRGHGGHDTISGGDGDDYIEGGDGRDRILGGNGNDTIFGGNGPDTLFGGDGDDYIDGGPGNDRLIGGNGNDTLIGGGGNDTLMGGNGDDYLSVSGGRNTLSLGRGDDLAEGGSGPDKIYGFDGNDTIYGGGGNDSLAGGKGNDVIEGGSGNDKIFGFHGRDWLSGGEGNDSIWGGNGNDMLFGGDGNDQLYGGADSDTLSGDAGNDAIWGGRGDDLIYGGDGDDWLSGESGNDTLYGGEGNDTFRGGAGTDYFWGGGGADVFEFFGNHDTGWIMDFNPSEGDILRLDDAMWASAGNLTPDEVVSRFGSIDDMGNLVLDFTDVGGAVIILNDYHDLAGLSGSIELM